MRRTPNIDCWPSQVCTAANMNTPHTLCTYTLKKKKGGVLSYETAPLKHDGQCGLQSGGGV